MERAGATKKIQVFLRAVKCLRRSLRVSLKENFIPFGFFRAMGVLIAKRYSYAEKKYAWYN